MSLLFTAQTTLAVCIGAIAWWFLHQYTSQRSLRCVPGPSSPSLLVGNMKQMFSPPSLAFQDHLNRTYGKVIKLNGLLGAKLLFVSDTKALYSILIKDQNVFEEAEWFLEANRVVFGPGLLATLGAPTHRKQRKILNPAFSINHMRRMIPMFQSITLELQDILRRELADGSKEIDMLEWMGKLALELIAQAGLGTTFGALQGENNDYARAIKIYVPTISSVQLWRTLVPLYTSYVPQWLQRSLAKAIPSATLKSLIDISDTMYDRSKEVWEKKKALHAMGDNSIVNQLGEGKDLMSLLLQSNITADEKDRLPDEELVAQMATFMFAGTDTTSSALSRILYQLAMYPDIQERLRKEVSEAGGDKGQLDYDTLIALPYLEAVCRETLRLFPPVPSVQRTQDFVVPLSQPIKGTDGKDYNELLVPNGTTIVINIRGVNYDPDIWGQDAHEWKPERWLSPLPESVSNANIPGVYANQMTFIGGGRACIGFKFSQLEMKVVLSQLISVFRFELPSKEIIWRWGNIISPSVVSNEGSHKSSLPMKVTLI
ncbi:cytochrome P450 [Amylostereum chailletii]|nr:cytochrome P450 [Amylostereum chailletii]